MQIWQADLTDPTRYKMYGAAIYLALGQSVSPHSWRYLHNNFSSFYICNTVSNENPCISYSEQHATSEHLPQQEKDSAGPPHGSRTRGQGHDRHGCQCSLTGCSKMPAANERPVTRGRVHSEPPEISEIAAAPRIMLTVLLWSLSSVLISKIMHSGLLPMLKRWQWLQGSLINEHSSVVVSLGKLDLN